MTQDAENLDKWCFAWFKAPAPTSSQAKAALVKGSKWQSGDTISISFIDGTDEQKALVRKFAPEWTMHLANLRFAWLEPPNTDIPISFANPGSWSVIGTTCRNVPQDQATMNFGWLTPGVTDEEARRVILHEFGHALGLIHEHQNPLVKSTGTRTRSSPTSPVRPTIGTRTRYSTTCSRHIRRTRSPAPNSATSSYQRQATRLPSSRAINSMSR